MPAKDEKVSEIFPVGAEYERIVQLPAKPPQKLARADNQVVGESLAGSNPDGGSVVDTRTGNEPLNEVATDADALTTLADNEESGFITGVEQAHKKS